MQNGYTNVQRATRNKKKESEYDLKNPKDSKRPDRTDKLICKPCLNLGYSSRDTSPYKCDGCGQDRGHTAYPQKGVRCCEECSKTKTRCSKCNAWKNIAAEKWKTDEVQITKRGFPKLLRVPCQASGITKHSTDMKNAKHVARAKAEHILQRTNWMRNARRLRTSWFVKSASNARPKSYVSARQVH